MKDIAQEFYENIEKNIDKYDYLHLFRVATLSMVRTNKLICTIANSEELSEIVCLVEYIHKYLYDFDKIHTKIIDENVEDFLEASAEIIESINMDESKVLYLSYELCESWYNYVNLLHYGCTNDDKKDLVSYITLPIQLLDNYVSDEIYLEEKNQLKLNQKVRLEKRIKVEEDFIYFLLKSTIDKDNYKLLFEQCVNYDFLWCSEL